MTKTTGTTADEARRGEFRVFQVQYLFVYLLTMFADWLQGTHMYVLYESYSSKGSTGLVGEHHPSRWGKTAIDPRRKHYNFVRSRYANKECQ